jgi:hypothetical protein
MIDMERKVCKEVAAAAEVVYRQKYISSMFNRPRISLVSSLAVDSAEAEEGGNGNREARRKEKT